MEGVFHILNVASEDTFGKEYLSMENLVTVTYIRIFKNWK
jgi:hypothetical protein